MNFVYFYIVRNIKKKIMALDEEEPEGLIQFLIRELLMRTRVIHFESVMTGFENCEHDGQ